MITATFSEFRNNAKRFFDAVEAGKSVEIFRNGKPVAVLSPYQSKHQGYWKKASPLKIRGVSLSKLILSEREEGI